MKNKHNIEEKVWVAYQGELENAQVEEIISETKDSWQYKLRTINGYFFECQVHKTKEELIRYLSGKIIKEEKPIEKVETFIITVCPNSDEEKTITILGGDVPKTISVPIGSEITINLNS